MRPLTTDFERLDARPYFLWDEDISIAELRETLRTGTEDQKERLVGKMLREARDIGVWHFVTPQEAWDMFPKIERRIGKKRAAFGRWLFEGWVTDGYLT